VAETRRTVTVLFADVTSSTELGERLDPEALRRVMYRFFDEMRVVLERHGAIVEKYAGDDIMAVFGIPELHEDDALRAARAARTMLEALERLNEELEPALGIRLEMRVGINTGEVVAGDPVATTTLATGEAVNLAKRIQEAAEPGEIMLGKETHQLIRGEVTAGPLESFSLRGRERPVSRLQSLAPTVARPDVPLVGRDGELALLKRHFEQAITERNCRLVTILGPAGVGKSRLVQELSVRLLGASFHQGRCLPYGDGVTFWPVREVVRRVTGMTIDDPPAQARTKLAALLQGEPESHVVCDRVGELFGFSDASGSVEDTFWAIRVLFEALARRRPLVLAFEDVHWAQPVFLDLLEYLAGWGREAPLLLLCVARPELLELRPAWARIEVVSVEPLTWAQTHELVERALPGAPPPLAERIWKATEGNPLHAEEMVRMLIEEGALKRSDGHWVPARNLDEMAPPPTVQALIAARLDRLDPDERTVLESAAVIGRHFPWSGVYGLAEEPLRNDVAAMLQALARKKMIVPDASAMLNEDTFRFSHIIVRDVAYQAIPKVRRAELHERFANWLDERLGGRVSEHDELVGYHLEQAYRARAEVGLLDEPQRELADRAVRSLGAAGRRAADRGDIPAAIALLQRSAALAERGERSRAEVLVELVSLLMAAGKFHEMEAALQTATEAAAEADDRSLQVRTELQRTFLSHFVSPRFEAQEITRVVGAVLPELEELGDDLGLAKAWWLLSELHAVACRWGMRAEALEAALEHARAGGHRRLESMLIGWLGEAILYGQTPVDEAIARCEQLRTEAPGRPASEAGILTSIAGLQAMRGEFDEARRCLARASAIDDELGLALRQPRRSIVASAIELLAEDADAAVAVLREGYEALGVMGERAQRAATAAYLADVLSEQGALDEAGHFSQIAEELATDADLIAQVLFRCTRAKALALRGDHDAAEELMVEASTRVADADFPDLKARALLRRAEVLRLAGRTAEAATFVGAAVDTYEVKGNVVGAAQAAALLGQRVD
jgi:class 3 adenylate cyclase/tetratricopeptide (TPR) repeat protein